MIEKGKISSLQMAMMMNPTILATAILLVPAITSKFAGRDMWISPILASLVGFFAVYIAYQLNRLFPNETIVQYSNHIVGQFFGKILGLLYLLFYLDISGEVVREYAEFVVGTFLIHTPKFVIIGSVIFVCSYAVKGGLEVLGRTTQLVLPIVIVLFLITIMLLIPEMKTKNMLPIMEGGIKPSILGSMTPQSWFSEFIMINFFLPFLADREKGLKWSMISVLSVVLILFMFNISALLVFGAFTPFLTYPTMSAARYISIADFLEHLEAIVMAFWVMSAFIKISVFYYTSVLAAAQWLNLLSYRPIVLPIGLLIGVLGFWVAPNLPELLYYFSTGSVFYMLVVQIGIPFLLLIIAFLRNRIKLKKVAQKC